jgi:AraC-like DNA-binding protein/uncharacterized membrane protein YfcA
MEAQEILQDIFFVILYGVVMGLSVAAALYLLLRRSNAIAPGVTPPKRLRLWAAAIMLENVFSHVLWLLYFCHPSIPGYILVCTLDILLLIPIIAGFLLSMLQDRHRPVRTVVVALVPAIVLSALGIICQDEAFMDWLRIYVIVFFALFMLYMFSAVRRYGRWLRDNYADLENKEVWQSFLILVVLILLSILYLFTSEQSKVLIYLLEYACIVIMALLLWRVETLQALSESTTAEEPAGEETASVPQELLVDMTALLKKNCEEKQLYLQHNLSLSQLALAVGTNHYYLSQYFSQQGLTYNAYINGLRIGHFISLYQKAVAEGRAFTAQQLASESGYRSYSTFSAAFKQRTGKSVTAWMRGAGE